MKRDYRFLNEEVFWELWGQKDRKENYLFQDVKNEKEKMEQFRKQFPEGKWNWKQKSEYWKRNRRIGDYGEKLVKENLEKENWKVMKVWTFINKSPKLNPFLDEKMLYDDYTYVRKRNKKIREILKSLTTIDESGKRKCLLPDFICFKERDVKFVEVKTSTWKSKGCWKIRTRQLKSIDSLRESGYEVEVVVPTLTSEEIDELYF